jgi:putative peptidoglycan lipid II flippase
VAIATVNLARVSRDVTRGDHDALRRNLAASLRTAAVLAIPATAGLVALREPIVRLLFEHGQFTAEATRKTAAAVLCYALGLFAYAVTKIQVPTFYALGQTRTPVRASVTAVTLKIAANFVLIAALARLGFDPFLGLALSTSLAAWINFSWLAVGLRRRLGRLRGEDIVATALRMVAVAAAMGVACHLLHGVLERALGGGGLAGEAGRLAVTIAVGAGLAAAGAILLRVREAETLLARLRAKLT